MTKEELLLAAQLLDLAADEFGNHGCNDFALPATEANLAIVIAADDDAPGPPPKSRGGVVVALDWMLMRHLASRLRAEAGRADPGGTEG